MVALTPGATVVGVIDGIGLIVTVNVAPVPFEHPLEV
jgi:hypothetical protein